jgi:hypothetical protein
MTRTRAIVLSLLVAVAVVGIGYAFTLNEEGGQPVLKDSAVARVYPEPGAQVPRQDTIYVELVVPYTGVLRIDDVEIPEDQLTRIQIGNSTRVSYTPGPGTETGALRAGPHRATAVFWESNKTREEARTFPWNFRVD